MNEKMKNKEIKACQCGGQASLKKVKGSHYLYRIECLVCGIMSRTAGKPFIGALIKSWNQRPTPSLKKVEGIIKNIMGEEIIEIDSEGKVSRPVIENLAQSLFPCLQKKIEDGSKPRSKDHKLGYNLGLKKGQRNKKEELAKAFKDGENYASQHFQTPQIKWPEENRLPLELKYCEMEIYRKNQNLAPLFNEIRNETIRECKAANPVKEIWEDELPKKFNGADLCAVREDFGWWVGYESKDLENEISATGKTLDEAFNKLNDYWFKSGKATAKHKGIK